MFKVYNQERKTMQTKDNSFNQLKRMKHPNFNQRLFFYNLQFEVRLYEIIK